MTYNKVPCCCLCFNVLGLFVDIYVRIWFYSLCCPSKRSCFYINQRPSIDLYGIGSAIGVKRFFIVLTKILRVVYIIEKIKDKSTKNVNVQKR